MCNDKNASFISGEVVSCGQLDEIPDQHQAALYVALRNIQLNGEEALKILQVEHEKEMTLVQLKNWKIHYRENADGLDFVGLEYCSD